MLNDFKKQIVHASLWEKILSAYYYECNNNRKKKQNDC